MPTTDDFPLVTLQPLVDTRQGWTALLLCGDRPLDAAALLRIINGYGLHEVLTDLPCVACVDLSACDPAELATLPAQHVKLALSATQMADAALEDRRAALRAVGFELVAEETQASPAAVPATASSHVQKKDSPAAGLLLKLMGLVTSDADSDEIEALIKRDPNLSYQLLKLVNSVAYAPGKKITSFSQAIAMLGRRQLQRWLQLLLYARPPGSQVASTLLPRAAQRAGLMESLAKRRQLSREMQDHAFMVGMFSLLDQLFGVPLGEVIKPLNLADDVVAGLTGGAAPLGDLLTVVAAADARPDAALAQLLAKTGIAREDLAAASVEAFRWAVRVSKEA